MKKNPITDKRIVICLGGGLNQLFLVTSLRTLGFQVIVVDKNPMAPAVEFADEYWEQSTLDFCKLNKRVAAKVAIGEAPYRIVARSNSETLTVAARLGREFDLRGFSESLINVCTQKQALHHLCLKLGIPTLGIAIDEDSIASLNDALFPIVVRPNKTLIGKKDIFLCDNRQDLKFAIEKSGLASADGIVDFAVYTEGRDISCLVMIDEGIASPIFYWEEINRFVDDYAEDSPQVIESCSLYSNPYLEPEVRANIKFFLSKFASFFKGDSYPLAFSWRVSKENIFLIEVHADLTGDGILDWLIPSSVGLDVLPYISQLLVLDEKYQRDWIVRFLSSLDALRTRLNSVSRRNLDKSQIEYLDGAGAKAKVLLIVGLSEMQLPIVRAARKVGFSVFVTNKKRNDLCEKFADRFYEVDGCDHTALVKIGLEINRDHEVVGVYCGADFCVKAMAKVHAALGINSPSTGSVERSLDKYQAKLIWRASGVPTPDVLRADSDSFRSLKKSLNYPLVVKPSNSCGSQGVSLVSGFDFLDSAIDAAKAFSAGVLIEEYFEGIGIDTIGILWGGEFLELGIGDRCFSSSPFCFPLHGSCPSVLTKDEQERAFELTKKAALSLGLNNTPIKADLLFKKGVFSVIEVTPRFHGDVFTNKLIPFSFDFSPAELWMRVLDGESLSSLRDKFIWRLNDGKVVLWKALFPLREGIDFLQIRELILKWTSAHQGSCLKEFYINSDKRDIFDRGKSFKHADNTSLVGFFWVEFSCGKDKESFLNFYKKSFDGALL